MTKKCLVSIFAAAAMLVCAGAWAQAAPVYLGFDIGNADFGSTDDTAFKVYGGYQAHPNFAAEVAFSQLIDKTGFEVSALEIDAVGLFPLAPQISLLGKLGFARIDVSPGEDENEFTFGVGVQYDANRNVGVRLQWQRYATDPDIDLITIGVLFKF